MNSAATSKLDDLKAAAEAAGDKQAGLLQDLQASQQSQASLVFGWTGAIKEIVGSLGNLHKTCIDMSNSVRQLLTSNASLVRSIQMIQCGLPTPLECTLLQDPFILEDAIGRVAPVHLQFIESWDAFEAVLEARFRGIQGWDKVQQREYALQDRRRGSEISPSRPWGGAFLPGQRIDMSFVFENTIQHDGDEVSQETDCPSCHCSVVGHQDLDTEWSVPHSPPSFLSLPF